MKLIKAIHMPKWSVEIFEMEKTGCYAIRGKNHRTGQDFYRVFQMYDTVNVVFDRIVAGMEGR